MADMLGWIIYLLGFGFVFRGWLLFIFSSFQRDFDKVDGEDIVILGLVCFGLSLAWPVTGTGLALYCFSRDRLNGLPFTEKVNEWVARNSHTRKA